MEKTFKNRNLLVIVFEILIIALALGGITFATQKLLSDSAMTKLSADEYNLDFVGDTNVSINGLEPISDNLIDYNTKDNVIRLEFSVRGVKENNNDKLIYDVMLSDMNIDCSLLNKYTKWNLYKNGRLISNGSMDPQFDGDVLGDTMRLTNIQEDLPSYKSKYDKYVLIFWISESCNDLNTCSLVDQSNIVNSKMDMKVFIALYSGTKKRYERIANFDNSCANRPELYNNMIPVMYKDGEWVVADKNNNNTKYIWYDYNNQKWANSIVVLDKSKYDELGKKIENNDILANLVWIPRYRYKLWNVTNEVSDSYKAYENGIDIIFESGVNSVMDSKIDNNLFITHPAFGNDLRGFWISKYEISKIDDKYMSIYGNDSYRNDELDNYKNIIDSISSNYNLGNNVESHMISNLEWGATLYLSHSKYGVCNGDGCSSISVNNSYKSGSDKQDTTTRNVYGVYDMAGASMEYVNGKSEIGTATNEVMLTNQDSWYNGNGLVSEKDYTIRGGIGHGMFYFGDLSMDSTNLSTRFSLVNKG